MNTHTPAWSWRGQPCPPAHGPFLRLRFPSVPNIPSWSWQKKASRQPCLNPAYSQNVGIVTTNKVVNRTVFAFAGGFLLLAGVSPKFAAVLTTIPQCVLGGATVTVFSTIAMTGMKLIASQDLTARNTTIVGLSAALGVGISQASAALSQFPEAVTMIFGKSPVVIATLMAVLLNLILPKEK